MNWGGKSFWCLSKEKFMNFVFRMFIRAMQLWGVQLSEIQLSYINPIPTKLVVQHGCVTTVILVHNMCIFSILLNSFYMKLLFAVFWPLRFAFVVNVLCGYYNFHIIFWKACWQAFFYKLLLTFLLPRVNAGNDKLAISDYLQFPIVERLT